MFVVFSGQGSQKMHMGRLFADNERVISYIKQASKIVNMDIMHLVMDATSNELNLTQNAQLAIFVMSYALFKLVEPMLGPIHAMAGHSLGEYTALAAAGIISFEDACMFIKERSFLMQQVSGKMLAVLGMDKAKLNLAASLVSNKEKGEECYIANINSSTQIVLSGNEKAIDRAHSVIAAIGGRSVVLPVSGPFHSPYMQDACQKLEGVIDRLDISIAHDRCIQVFSNVTSYPEHDWKKIIKVHMSSPVLWAETLANMSVRYPSEEFIEIGATSLLTSMAKRDGYNMKYIEKYVQEGE